MSISVVMPAHNEEAGIVECLTRLSQQGDEVIEILVVNNNSTDRTAELVHAAATTDPRIRLLDETRAGVAYARYAGFDAAAGELIASVDSDTLVDPGWATAIATTMVACPDIVAGGGTLLMHDLPRQERFRRKMTKLHAKAAQAIARGEPLPMYALSGANSVIRTTAWREIRADVSYRPDLFEDLDRSLLLQQRGHTLTLIPDMTGTVSGRRLLNGPRQLVRYAACGPRTYRFRGKPAMAVIAYLANLVALARTMILLPVNRAWDPLAQRYVWRRALRPPSDVRESPIG